MDYIGQPERNTQNRILKLFTEVLKYDYLGNWEDRPNNQNIEEKYFEHFCKNKEQRGFNKPCHRQVAHQSQQLQRKPV